MNVCKYFRPSVFLILWTAHDLLSIFLLILWSFYFSSLQALDMVWRKALFCVMSHKYFPSFCLFSLCCALIFSYTDFLKNYFWLLDLDTWIDYFMSSNRKQVSHLNQNNSRGVCTMGLIAQTLQGFISRVWVNLWGPNGATKIRPGDNRGVIILRWQEIRNR